MKKIILGIFVLCSLTLAVELGKVPKKVILSGENGGKVDGTAWTSSILNGKVSAL